MSFRPVVYLKEKCPFSMKVRIFLVEAGLQDRVEVKDVAPGTEQDRAVRSELETHLGKVSFPSAQPAPGEYMTDSDAVVGRLASDAGVPARGPLLEAYVEGPFQQLMQLHKENTELRKQQA